MNKAIQRIFSDVTSAYELINHVLTFGLDILWRRSALKAAVREGGRRWLDICSGTGQMAAYLDRLAGKDAVVAATDFSLPMIHEASMKRQASNILFAAADSHCLPFRSETFDLVTISFATRNINLSRQSLVRCVQEAHRILKPGGRFINLETSQPPSRLVRTFYHLYVRLAVRRLGHIISGSKAAYAYLSHTIPRFYDADELASVFHQAGFTRVNYRRVTLGVVAIHEAVK